MDETDAEFVNSNDDTEDDKNDTKAVSYAVKKMMERMLGERNYTMRAMQHNTNPHLNCSRYNIPSKHLQKTELRVTLPTPVFTSTHGSLEIDPSCKRVLEHRRYMNSLRWMPYAYKRCESKKVYRNVRKKGVYSYNIINFARLLEQNPDEYFSGRYDWYYTGGNLDTFNYNDEKYVVHATGKRLVDLNISKAETHMNHTKLTRILRKRTKVLLSGNRNPEILEIQTLNRSHLSVRRRNYLSLYTFEDDALKYRFHLHNGVVPFISSTKESDTSANILTSDLNKTVALWDLNVSAERPKQLLFSLKNNEKCSNWNCLRYIDDNIYGFADQNKFYTLDSRQSPEANHLSYYNVHPHTELCDINTIMCPSQFRDLIYLGSTHTLLAIDRRFMGSNFKENQHIVMKWTHQMSGYPLMLRTTHLDNVETILMASNINGDVRICENNRVTLREPVTDDDNWAFAYSSPSLPIVPPSMNDAYRRARLEGLCLNPYTFMEQRLRHCHVGVSFLNTEEYQSILVANSNGDIFSHILTDAHEEAMINEDNLATMKQWQDELLNIDIQNRPALNVTTVQNLESLKKVFRCDQLNVGAEEEDPLSDQVGSGIPRGRWRRSTKMLQGFKDFLAADILSIWDLEQDHGENAERLVLPSQVEEPVEKDIDKWLKENEVAEVDESILSTLNLPIDNTLNESALNSQVLDEPVSQKKTIKPAKRKYVKGF